MAQLKLTSFLVALVFCSECYT